MDMITPEERFKELFFDKIKYVNTTYYYDSDIPYFTISFYNNSKFFLAEYVNRTNTFRLSKLAICIMLESEFDLKMREIINPIKDILEGYFNLMEISIVQYMKTDFGLYDDMDNDKYDTSKIDWKKLLNT